MKVIAIDFDKTIYFGFGTDRNGIVDPQSVIEITKLMNDRTNFIVIHTARRKDQRGFVESVLNQEGIPYHAIVMEKLRADVYIDDKNVGGLKWLIKK